MKRMYKYPVPQASDKFSLSLPQGAEPKIVQWQGDKLYMWALVDPDAAPATRRFRTFGTGHDIADDLKYVTTYFSGPFVMHLFEE